MNIVEKTIVCILVLALLAAEESDARGRHPKHSHAGRPHPHSHAGRPRPKNCEEVGGIFRVHGCNRISEVPYTSVNGKGWGKKCCIPRTCSAGNNTGLCTRSRSCDSDSSFCVRNIDSCTGAHPRAYCKISKPVHCSSGNSSGSCKYLHSCDLYLKTSHPVQTEVCSALGKNVACCIKGPAPCSVSGQTGVCQLCCASDTSFCVPNITACSNIQPDLYCSISQPVSCSSGNSSGTCTDTLSCDLETSHPMKTDVCSELGKNAACCLKGHAPCSVAGQKGVCKLSCASNTSFCVPNVTDCTNIHSSAYCSISKPVKCSSKNISGICTDSESCDLETSHPVMTNTCTALCKKAACCVNEPAPCSVAGQKGVCKLSCASNTSFCVPNVTDCTNIHSSAYCSISKPVKCSSKNISGICTDSESCDLETSHPVMTNTCTALCKKAACCVNEPAPCSVAGQKGVCKLSCASNTSFCVPNVTDCTNIHSSAYCSISKPVKCSSKNISGICTDSESCDLETSHPVMTNMCTALCKKAACCVNVPAPCSVAGHKGVCKLSCASNTSFCVPNVTACTDIHSGAYCSFSKAECDEVGGILRVNGCDAVSEVPYLPFNEPQGRKKCCLPRTCSVAGVTRVCQLNCDPTKSFCVPNIDNCTSVNSAAFCDISKPVKCSSVNGMGYCTDICSCEPETSTVATSNVCAALSENTICCTETGVGQRFTKANLTGISQSLVIDDIETVENLTCCHNYCILNRNCRAFALFESEENGNKTCRLMKSPQFCSSEDPSPGLKLIEYFENQKLRRLERPQRYLSAAVLPANVSWFSDCWSEQCPIGAAVAFRDYSKVLSQEVDYITCGYHSSDMILSTSGAVAMDVVSDLQSRCPPNYLLTAVQDNTSGWTTLDHYKCLRLSDDWETIESKCMLHVKLKVTRFECPPVNGIVSYIVGIGRNGKGLQGITCCPVVKLQP
ncbi:Uncharacterised protein g8481 [Pycnogonum litorale]